MTDQPTNPLLSETLVTLDDSKNFCGVNSADLTLRELEQMALGRMSHDWDLFAQLICFVFNPHVLPKYRLTVEQIHPYRDKKAKKVKPFNRADWLSLKARIKGAKQ